MSCRPSLRGLAIALAAATVVPVLAVPAASAEEPQTVVDVLKVVDGEYVVETVTVPAAGAEATAADLEDAPEVVAASPQVVYQVDGQPDPYWDADDPGAVSHVRDVWPRTRGAGQVVAVLDTAVDLTHEDLAGAVVPGTDIAGGAVDGWHGLGVAGVIAARADNGLGSAGMAPDARVMPVRVCNDAGCSSGSVARGILWAVDHGADVINMSLSGAGYSDVTLGAIQYALGKNISVVASAGNSGLDGNPVMYPAANSGVIAVSATAPDGAPADWAVHGWQVDVSTVGDGVLMPMPGDGYGNGTGTSFSGPAVAGAVALLRSSRPGITTEEVQAALQAGVDSAAWDRAWGAGRLGVPTALAASDRTAAAPTVTTSPQTLDVSWAPVAGATGYTVRVDGTVRATVTGTNARVTGLTDGNQVAVDVQPSNGDRSRPVLATVGPTAPGVPTLHSASISGTSTSAVVNLSVSVAGAVAPKYGIIRDGVSIGAVSWTPSSTPRTLSLQIGPMPTQETRWQLRAVDALGRTSAASNAVVAGSGRPPAPVTPPTGLAGRVDGDQTLLTWDDLGTAYTYRVSVGGTVVDTPQTAGSALPAPPAGGQRSYDVAVVDAWGQAGPTARVSVTSPVAAVPGAPTGVSAVAGDRQATVSWTAAPANGSPVAEYRVTASPGGASVTTTGTTATVPGLVNGTAYTFTVTAANAVGTGPASSASPAVTPVAPVSVPGAPTAVTAVAGNGRAVVSWSAAPDNGSPVTAYTVTASPGTATATTTGATTATVTGLQNGTSYVFRVTAANVAGTGPASAASAAATPRAPSAITVAHQATGGDVGPWGAPTGAEICGLRDGGCYRGFSQGTAYWSAASGAHLVSGAVAARWAAQGWESGPMGYPLTDTVCGLPDGGCAQTFQSARVYASASTAARAVWGAIAGHYVAGGAQSGALGYPTTEEICGLRSGGCYQGYQRGTVYWSAASGAHTVSGVVAGRWADQGWEGGPMGYPVTDTVCGLADNGCFQHFQVGSIFSSATGGARRVWGAIRDRWAAEGWEFGAVGYPVTEEVCGLRSSGCYQGFRNATVYWSPTTGAFALSGPIRDAWAAQGWETGKLGYPTSRMTCSSTTSCTQAFQGGTASWTAGTGVRVSR
ncbi:S8 family serine peptidase [Modestobacter sp. URMC 112]